MPNDINIDNIGKFKDLHYLIKDLQSKSQHMNQWRQDSDEYMDEVNSFQSMLGEVYRINDDIGSEFFGSKRRKSKKKRNSKKKKKRNSKRR